MMLKGGQALKGALALLTLLSLVNLPRFLPLGLVTLQTCLW